MGRVFVSDPVDGRDERGGGGVKRANRSYSPAYKQRILEELDAATEPGDQGRILRRERLYSSNVGRWRRQRDEAIRAGLGERKRGPKVDPVPRQNRLLRERNELLEDRLRTAEELVEAQGKAFELLRSLSRKGGEPR
jgi:transposase